MKPTEMVDKFSEIIKGLAAAQLNVLRNTSGKPIPQALPAMIKFADSEDASQITSLKIVMYVYRESLFMLTLQSDYFRKLFACFDNHFSALDDYVYFLQSMSSGDAFTYFLTYDETEQNLLPALSEHPRLSAALFKKHGQAYLQTLDNTFAHVSNQWFNADLSFKQDVFEGEFGRFLFTVRELHEKTIASTGLPNDDILYDRLSVAAQKFHNPLVDAVIALPTHQNKNTFTQVFLSLRQQLEADMVKAYKEGTDSECPYHQNEHFSQWMQTFKLLAKEIEDCQETYSMCYRSMIRAATAQQPKPVAAPHVVFYDAQATPVQSRENPANEGKNSLDKENASKNPDDNIVSADAETGELPKQKTPQSSPSRGSGRHKAAK